MNASCCGHAGVTRLPISMLHVNFANHMHIMRRLHLVQQWLHKVMLLRLPGFAALQMCSKAGCIMVSGKVSYIHVPSSSWVSV